jgi:molybdopterin-guanine dinucleotide biosynthesis adapter protein
VTIPSTTPVPVVSIVGKSDSGKTTFLEKLIRTLSVRGWRVGTVKHHVHEFDIDVPGKDSWRHARAGAVVTMVSSPAQFAAIQHLDRERTLPELAAYASEAGADILLTEGYKATATARIEVSRRDRSESLISTPGELIALVTDNGNLRLDGISSFGLDDAEGVASLIEQRFLGGLTPRDRDSAAPEAGVPDGD